jgi:hypothetical protein
MLDPAGGGGWWQRCAATELVCRGGIERATTSDESEERTSWTVSRPGAGRPAPRPPRASVPAPAVSTVDRFGDPLHP